MDAKEIRSIVVATDLTHESDRVVRAAVSIAALTGAELYVIHVHVVPAGLDAEWLGAATPRAEAIRHAARDLEDQLQRVAPPHLAPADQAVVTATSASEAIRRRAGEVAADLVVLGPHRGSRGDLPFLGTTADRLIRTVGVPCLIVRGPMDFPVRRIGVLTDFSAVARAAQETAVAWMEAFSAGASSPEGGAPAHVAVAHIARPTEGTDREALERTKILPAVHNIIDDAVRRARIPDGIDYAPEVLWSGDAADAVAGWVRARGLAMVVLGTQGGSGFPDPYLGSLASTVARSAPCSVLLVPPGYAPASARVGAGTEVPLRRVVAGVDFHESSSDAALWVMRYFAPDAELDLLHVVDLPDLPGPLRGLAHGREQALLAAREGARHRLDEIRDLGGAPRVETHVREGKPAAEILRLASEVGADLVVVGEQGPTRGVGALLGSTAERVLIGSRVPVLVPRKVAEAPPSRLLIGIDPSGVSGQLLAWVGALLARFDATAVVLNVVDRLLLFDEITGRPTARALRRLEEEASDAMRKWLDTTVRAAGLPGWRVQTKVLVGDPSYEIIAEAARQRADLVLVGSKGGDVARTPMIGRIINRVVRSAPCSVLVVTPRGAARASTGSSATTTPVPSSSPA